MLKLVHSKLDFESQLTEAIQQLKFFLKAKPTDTVSYELHLLEKYFSGEGFALLCPHLHIVENFVNEEIVQCVVSLDSTLAALNELEQLPRSEIDIKSWMDIVLESTLCRLIDVKFPLDAAGNAGKLLNKLINSTRGALT